LPRRPTAFYFHGTPSSRLEFRLFGGETIAQKLHLRVIVPDRPGLGLSDFQAGRQLLDWPEDVIALADHLKLEQFAILGYSGGGPYAAACGYAIPQRISKIGIVSGAGPFDQSSLVDGIPINNLRFMSLVREKPRLSQLSLRMMAIMLRLAPETAYAILTEPFPASDQAVAAKEPFKQGLALFSKRLCGLGRVARSGTVA
jgi:pimeloyl-ACP methyl ester carboxylesterase